MPRQATIHHAHDRARSIGTAFMSTMDSRLATVRLQRSNALLASPGCVSIARVIRDAWRK
jgi:hypothetical protein